MSQDRLTTENGETQLPAPEPQVEILPSELPKEFRTRFEIKDQEVANKGDSPYPSELDLPPGDKPPQSKKSKSKPSSVSSKRKSSQVFYPNRRPIKDPIWIGEKQTFGISYFAVPAGDFVLDVLPHKTINDRKVYHIRGRAVSSDVFSVIYRLDDVVETFLDFEGIFSHRFHMLLNETKQTRDALELYDSEKRQTYYWNRWNHKTKGYIETKEFHPIEPFSHDTLSALYYLRTIPLPTGKVFTVPIVSEGKNWEAVVTVMGREMVDSPMGRIRTVVVKPEMKLQGVLQKRGDSFIWLTDDDRRFVVRIEAKVKIGTVVAALKSVEPGTAPENVPSDIPSTEK